MRIETTPIRDLLVIHPRVFEDQRGFFYESYNERKFREQGIEMHWAQDNQARSVQATLRGLHFQRGRGQAKLVRCTSGRVWDVAVDIRPQSPTLGQWYAIELSDNNRAMFLIPEGFAHGYCVLSPEAEVQYKCSTVYDAALECEIAWNDPSIGVEWPIDDPILSDRDVGAGSFEQYLAQYATPPREKCGSLHDS